MSYDRINPDGSITRMPGTYNVRKAKATIQRTIDINLKLREQKKQKASEDLADRSERIASYLAKLRDNKSANINDYVPKE